jgi:phage regulator Rha-like protein
MPVAEKQMPDARCARMPDAGEHRTGRVALHRPPASGIWHPFLTELYEVETKALNRAVKRNADRFPKDFMFQLTPKEAESLRCQIGTSNEGTPKEGRGGRRFLPYSFTEHGVAMLSSVLRSKRAVQINIVIVRAFIKLRELVATHKELAHKMEELERNQREQAAHIAAIYEMVEQLTAPADVPPSRRIGFVTDEK